MTVFEAKNLDRLPFELVDLIADYHDYDKYCKPGHKILLKNVHTEGQMVLEFI